MDNTSSGMKLYTHCHNGIDPEIVSVQQDKQLPKGQRQALLMSSSISFGLSFAFCPLSISAIMCDTLWIIQILVQNFKRQANSIYSKAVNSLILLYGRDLRSFYTGRNFVIGATDLLADHRNTILQKTS